MSRKTSRPRTLVLGAVFALLGLPAGLAVVWALGFNAMNRANGRFVSSGEMREYLLYVPPGHDRKTKTPLVISLHGGALWGAAQREISQWNRVADEQGFIVVYPSGTGLARHRAWRAGPGVGQANDVIFLSELIDRLVEDYNIDPARVYVDGLSNGGGMAFVLACRLPERIAAVGMVSSAIFLPWADCPDHRPVPMIAFHGTADRFTPYHGGVSWVAPDHVFPDIPTFAAAWARRNHCRPEPTESAVAADVSRREYAGCGEDASVVLYTVLGGGHSWPGGGPLPEWFVGTTSRSIDASAEMWRFFLQYRLRAKGPPGAQRPA